MWLVKQDARLIGQQEATAASLATVQMLAAVTSTFQEAARLEALISPTTVHTCGHTATKSALILTTVKLADWTFSVQQASVLRALLVGLVIGVVHVISTHAVQVACCQSQLELRAPQQLKRAPQVVSSWPCQISHLPLLVT